MGDIYRTVQILQAATHRFQLEVFCVEVDQGVEEDLQEVVLVNHVHCSSKDCFQLETSTRNKYKLYSKLPEASEPLAAWPPTNVPPRS